MHHALTILAVTDLDRAARFYEAAFGWAVAVRAPNYVELSIEPGRGLGLYERSGFARNIGGAVLAPPPSTTTAATTTAQAAVTCTELYFRCDTVAELKAAIARLERAGARALSALAAREWGDEAAYFADVDGNVLVVARTLAGGSAH